MATMTLIDALFEEKISGIVAACYINERPLQGVAGWLDWKLHGILSHYVRQGALTGVEGETTYIPVTGKNSTYHIILVGAGYAEQAGRRAPLSPRALEGLKKNLKSLRIQKLGASQADLGHENLNSLLGIEDLWIT